MYSLTYCPTRPRAPLTRPLRPSAAHPGSTSRPAAATPAPRAQVGSTRRGEARKAARHARVASIRIVDIPCASGAVATRRSDRWTHVHAGAAAGPPNSAPLRPLVRYRKRPGHRIILSAQQHTPEHHRIVGIGRCLAARRGGELLGCNTECYVTPSAKS